MTTNCTIRYPHSHVDTHSTYSGPHHAVLDDAHLARQMDEPVPFHIADALVLRDVDDSDEEVA